MAKTALMIDIETIDILPTATILTIGAQGFDKFSDRFTDVTYYERITLESQEDRTIDEGTLQWWSGQTQEAQEEAFGENGRLDLKPALEKLGKLIWKADEIWANGTTFDMTILEHAYRQCNINLPWKYYKVCDARTVYKLVPQLPKLGNNHNALADCVNQIDLLQQAYKILKLQP